MKRTLEVAAVSLMAIVFVTGWWSLRVQARTDRAVIDDERPVAPDPRPHAVGPRPLMLNGETLMGRTGASPHPPDAVLAHVAATCRATAPEALFERLRGREIAPQRRDEVPGVFASWTERGGFAACLRTGDGGPDREGLRDFARTGDLAALGGVTYVEAIEDGTGSRLTALWSDGAFDPLDAIAAAPDAPSVLDLGAPRATLTTPDGTTTVELHRLHGPIAELRTTVAQHARANGWSDGEQLDVEAHRVMRFRRGDDELWAMLHESEDHVAVSVVSRRGAR